MPDPLVTAVIPSYNSGEFVADAVESALAQTYCPIEVLVVNDGSTDDTEERLEPYRDLVRVVRQDNQGLSAARNTGIREARGDWIALLDADDVWHPKKIETQLRVASRRPDAALVACGSQSDPEAFEAYDPDPIALQDASALDVSLEDLVLFSRFAPSSAILRREILDRVGGFDTELRSAEDRDMWIRVAAVAPVVKCPEPLLFYRVHSQSMSRNASRMELNELKVLEKNFRDIPALRQNPNLRRRAMGIALTASAWRFDEAGEHAVALNRLARSYAWWPLPYDSRKLGGRRIRRAQLAARVCAHILRKPSGERFYRAGFDSTR